MKKVLVYLLVSLMLLVTAGCNNTYGMDTTDMGEEASGLGLQIGDYITMGKYYDEPIVWRCVNTDENGMLVLSDKILCIKYFDEVYQGNDIGSHARRWKICSWDENWGHNCKNSNYWGDSTIRSWLNSTAPAGEVEWLCGNGSDAEKGFLAEGNFTQTERNVIKTVTQKSLLDSRDAEVAVGGSAAEWNRVRWSNIEKFVEEYYDNICYEYVTDQVFLLDIKQVRDILRNEDVLGSDYLNAKFTQQIIECYEDIYGDIKRERQHDGYFLRTPYGDMITRGRDHYTPSGDLVTAIDDKGKFDVDFHNNAPIPVPGGIRPAFYLNEAAAQILSGSGTAAEPYVLDGREIPVYVNGSKLDFDVTPILENDRTLVPLRAVFEALGAEVSWYGEERSIVAVRGDTTVFLQVDDRYMAVNDEWIELDAPPRIVNDRTLIPLRAVAEAFGAQVGWDGDTQTVTVIL